MVDPIWILVFFRFVFILGWILWKVGMWVDTRSDDGVAVAWQGPFLLTSLFREENICILLFCKLPKMPAIIQTICKNGILDPITFWLVP